MKTLLSMLLISLLGGIAGCDWIGDPWVTDPDQLAEERSRSPGLHDQLIDRAERGQRDR